jgi:predicted RNase H-like nuclease (RuvC/YqgF family)
MNVMPIDLVALTAVVMGCLIVLIPIAGYTLRYAIKPITEAMKKNSLEGTDRETLRMIERRMSLLEQEVHGIGEVREDLRRVLEEMDFRNQLEKPKP